MKQLFYLGLLVAAVGCQVLPPVGQTSQRFGASATAKDGLNYWLYLPQDYNQQPRQQWPVLLFLHGSGERGTNVAAVLKHGPPKLVQEGKQFPLIIVSPQCPPGQWWSPAVLNRLLDDISARYRVDPDRVYLSGLSMGGFGTWTLAGTKPERFAAIAPICGGGEIIYVALASRRRGEALQSLGVWAFHGAKDPVVKPEESERMVAALRKASVREVALTIYPEAQHDSWTATYADAKLYEWFLRHERK